jgi:hypothetical protein
MRHKYVCDVWKMVVASPMIHFMYRWKGNSAYALLSIYLTHPSA